METSTLFTRNFSINCTSCGREHQITESQAFCTNCGHGHPLTIHYKGDQHEVVLPHFLKSIPTVPETSLVKLRNKSREIGASIYVKNELEMPTGSFKDRGTAAEVSACIKYGYKEMVVASTGNMAVSLARETARNGVRLTVFVPENTPTPKLVAARKFGAVLKEVTGGYSECEKSALEYAKNSRAFLAGDYYVRAEGAKRVASELIYQMGEKSIDKIIVPGGVGTNAAAIMKGFEELQLGGFIKQVPQLVIVQPTSMSPIIDGLELGMKLTAPTSATTLCSAVKVANPYDFVKVEHAIKISNGLGIRVSDEEALRASKYLAEREGIDCELSGALTIAALKELDSIRTGQNIVCILTGAGFKDAMMQEEALLELVKI